jgi:hypothetical protein
MTSRFLKYNFLTPAAIAGIAIFVIALGFGILSLQAWLIGIVLGWFGVTLGFWKCFLIAFLLGCLFGGGASVK